jgi:hypothetical protein
VRIFMKFDMGEMAYVPTTGVRRIHETPLLAASESSLKGYGCLVDDPGGVTEGVFEFWWKGETLYARNNAVGPGDDVTPEQFVTFWCDGSRGLYIRPNIWHGAFVPLDDQAEFLDRQGRVHARVSVDFVKEFGCYLGAPLRRPTTACRSVPSIGPDAAARKL